MSFSDYDAAVLAAGIYAYEGDESISWDYFDPGDDDGICWAIKRDQDGNDNLVYRGSTIPEDFLRDVEAWAEPTKYTAMGNIHSGFVLNLDRAIDEYLSRATRPTRVIGHSLGAGRTAPAVGFLVCEGHPVIERIAFGEPRSGFQELANLIGHIPARSYRNGDGIMVDYVTSVPFSCTWLPYVHPTKLIDIAEVPSEFDQWGPFRFHHMQLYRSAMKRMFAPIPSAVIPTS